VIIPVFLLDATDVNMLRIKLLRNLLLLSLAIAIFLPGHEFLVVHPAYNNLLTAETESEAIRFASYMVRTLGLENQALTKNRLPDGMEKSLRPVARDKRLIKLRIFSTPGEIIFSTKADEIGNINERSYFHEIVAKGQPYSKVVRKDHTTAEGVVAQIDIVETYVPFMTGDAFAGAIEVYYDVTESVDNIKELSFHSMVNTLVLTFGFLLAIGLALYRAYISLLERSSAEEALRLANEGLEKRVEERTEALSLANQQLTDQVDERDQAQQALGQALEEIQVDREKLNGILRSVPDAVVVTDGELRVLHMNATAESVLDVSLDKMLGKSIGLLSHEADLVGKIEQQRKLKYGLQPFDLELPGENASSVNVYQARISPFITDEDESPGVVLLIRDVTREREIERMKTAFLGMAAHELNTPLTTIIGYSELLTAEETSANFDAEQQKNYLQLIHDKSLALGGLVDDLLDISRVESGSPLSLNYKTFGFDDMAREIVTSSREEHSQHLFELVLPKDPVPLCADPSRIDQVLEHLVSNAVKYSPDGGRIRVALTLHDNTCELSIEDEGIGMNEEQVAHIFDRFYRADSTDTAVQGVGLGMSVVRNIVLAHHGDILVDSQFGSGTRVTVTLPATPPYGYDQNHTPFSPKLS
jgi:PAS domain S-box-containing protein